MSAVPPRVYLVVATYRRPALLRRLLESLRTEAGDLAGVVLVNNSGDAETAAVASAACPVPLRLMTPPANLGTGGGLAAGMEAVLATPDATHLWILDDDAAATPGALRAMVAALKRSGAVAAVPLVVDAEGRLAWFPGPLPEPAWSAVRAPGATPASFRAACGEEPLGWSWAPWPSLLVTRAAVVQAGLPRADFWFQGEDIEWTLRLTACAEGVLAPAALCIHTPPGSGGEFEAREHRKRILMLQNNFFTGNLAHGRRLRRHAPGNVWRTLRAARFSPKACQQVLRAWWRGAVRRRAAGQAGGDGFRREWGNAM
jgi:GT2 family glycosyltransferase